MAREEKKLKKVFSSNSEKKVFTTKKIAAETLPNPSAQHQTRVAQRLVVGLHGLLITLCCKHFVF